jgi:hypothetical protein
MHGDKKRNIMFKRYDLKEQGGKHVLALYTKDDVKYEAVFDNIDEAMANIKSVFSNDISDTHLSPLPVKYNRDDDTLEFGDNFYWLTFSTLKGKADSIGHLWCKSWFNESVYNAVRNEVDLDMPPYSDNRNFENSEYVRNYILKNNK